MTNIHARVLILMDHDVNIRFLKGVLQGNNKKAKNILMKYKQTPHSAWGLTFDNLKKPPTAFSFTPNAASIV